MITIPEPCHEDWDKMQVVDSTRRHCASCEKTLVDFSLMSDDEIASFLRYNNKKLCGRFARTQLNRTIVQIPEPKQQSRWRMWLLFPLTLLGRMLNAQQDSATVVDSVPVVVTNDSITVQPDSLSMAENDTTIIPDSLLIAVDSLRLDTELIVETSLPLIWVWNPEPFIITVGPATAGVIAIVMGDISCPAPPAPFPTMIGVIGENAVPITPKSHPDKMFIDGGARRPPLVPKEKPKDDPILPTLPSMPWYAALIPVPFRRKQNGK